MINYNLNLIKLCSTSAKKNCSSNNCDQHLFFVNSFDIIWSSLTAPSLFNINFEQVYHEIFFSLKYLFHFCVSVADNITLFYKNNFVEVQPFSKYKSSLSQMFFEIVALKSFASGKQLPWRLFLNKFAGPSGLQRY